MQSLKSAGVRRCQNRSTGSSCHLVELIKLLKTTHKMWQPICFRTVHAVISVIHEYVYDKVQREVSKKKLDSLTSVAAAHESQRPKLVDERDEVFYTDLVATR